MNTHTHIHTHTATLSSHYTFSRPPLTHTHTHTHTATLSSHYTFSLHDTTSFDANLLLSSGEQHSEMLRTEVCLQGTASYDTNILTVRDFLQGGAKWNIMFWGAINSLSKCIIYYDRKAFLFGGGVGWDM